MKSKAIFLVILVGIMNGTTLLASRFSVGQYSTSNYLMLRFVIAALCYLFVMAFWKNTRVPRDWALWRHGIILGIMQAYSMYAIIMAMKYISSGINSILLAAGPVFTMILTNFFLPDEKLNRRKGIGILFALSGVFLITFSGETGLKEETGGHVLGYLLSLSGIFLASVSSVYIRKNTQKFRSFNLTFVRNSTILVITGLLIVFMDGFDVSNVDSNGWMALFYAALIGTFLAHLMSIYINKNHGATTSSLITFIIPIAANIGGYFLFGETISAISISGMGLIFCGIALINQKGTQFKQVFKSLPH